MYKTSKHVLNLMTTLHNHFVQYIKFHSMETIHSNKYIGLGSNPRWTNIKLGIWKFWVVLNIKIPL